MTSFKKIKKFVVVSLAGSVALVTVAGLSSCAANQGPSGFGAEEGVFGLLSLEDGPEGAKSAKRRHHKGFRKHGMKFLFKDLGLSLEQKSAFKALMQEGKESREAHRPQRQAVKAKIKAAFLSDNFDKVALKKEIDTLVEANKSQRLERMAQKMVKAYQILTPEQQVKLKSKMDKMEAKIASFTKGAKAHGFKGKHGKRLDKMTQHLGLSPEQVTQIKALFEAQKGDWKERMSSMKGIKTAVFSELSQNQPDAAKIKLALAPIGDKMGGKLEKKLDMMSQFHRILNPDQRQKMVEHMEKRGHKHGRRHGRHSHHG